MSDFIQDPSGNPIGSVRKPSELARLRKMVGELEIELEAANQRAFQWAKYSAASMVTISRIKNAIPANYRNQEILFADTSRRILSYIDNQPDQLTAAKLVFSAVIRRLNDRLAARIRAKSGPFSPQELKQWLASQVEEW